MSQPCIIVKEDGKRVTIEARVSIGKATVRGALKVLEAPTLEETKEAILAVITEAREKHGRQRRLIDVNPG